MQPDYRRDLFDAYHIRTSQLETDEPAKQEWFRIYSQSYYVPHLSDVDRATAEVLEAGCNKGFLLASLRDAGFRGLGGAALAPGAGLRPRLARLRIGTARTVVRTLLRWANPEGGENPIWARSLIAVAK